MYRELTYIYIYTYIQSADSYIHRVGRTARAGQTGTALSLVAGKEAGLLKEVEQRLLQIAGGETLRPYQVELN